MEERATEGAGGPAAQDGTSISVLEEAAVLIAREEYGAAYSRLAQLSTEQVDEGQQIQLHNMMLLCRNCARLEEDVRDLRDAAARAADQQRLQRHSLLAMLARMKERDGVTLVQARDAGGEDRPVSRMQKLRHAIWAFLDWLGVVPRTQASEIALPAEKTPVQSGESIATPSLSPPSASDFNTDLQVWGLGPFRVLCGLREVDRWRSRTSRAIFQLLLLKHPRPVPSELLMEVFWPEEDPDTARHRLHQAIYLLRRSLDNPGGSGEFVVHDGGGYLIDPKITLFVDFVRLEEHFAGGRRRQRQGDLTRAVAEWRSVVELHRGILYPEERYAEWPALRREQIRQKHLEALDRLSQYYLQHGPLPRAVGYCRQLLEADSCREDVHRRLMFAYWKQGHRHLALQQYEQCVATLQNELEVPPMPVTVELFEKIRDHPPP